MNTAFYEWIDTAGVALESVEKTTADQNKKQQQDETIGDRKTTTHYRAYEYSLPADIAPFISTVFNTVQIPPVTRNKGMVLSGDVFLDLMQSDSASTGKAYLVPELDRTADMNPKKVHQKLKAVTGSVTVPFLNQLYKIPSNIGNENLSQVTNYT